MWSLPGHSRQANKGHSPRCHRRLNGPGRLADKVVQHTTQSAEGCTHSAFSQTLGGRSEVIMRRIFPFNLRPAGVWIVTRPAGGGGGQRAPLRSPKLLDRFPNFKRHSIALYVNYPYKVKNLTRRSLMTSQVRSKSEFSTFRAW